MSSTFYSAQLASSLGAQRDAAGQVGLGTFLRGVSDFLKKLALEQIDTEQERDDLVAGVLGAADALVAGKFPPLLWRWTRSSIESYLDEAIDNLPALIAA